MNIRIGNDIPMAWRFYTYQDRQKTAYSMENRNLRLYMTDPAGRKESLNFTVSGNALLFTFYGRDQRRTGEYTLTLIENEGQPGMLTIDKIRPFCLTPLQETVHGGTVPGAVSELEIEPLELSSTIEDARDYNPLINKPSINGVTLEGNKSTSDLGLVHPYLSQERLRKYLYRVTFDSLPEDDGGESPAIGGCSSYVQDGKLYSNLDWDYDNTASFIVRTPEFEGQSMVVGLNDGNLDDDLIAQLPFRVHRGENNYGIKLAAHVLFNDWEWTGAGSKSISVTRLPFEVLTRVRSMATIASDLSGVLDNLYCPEGLAEMGYLLQILVTDGTTTYALLPPTSEGQGYVLQNIISNPKMTNFRWVDRSEVDRTDADIQEHPTGIERWNMMPCPLEDLRFTASYEQPARLSEFIGLRGTTKDSTDEELEAIYLDARQEYLSRKRDGRTWHTMESAVYGKKMESLFIQENWDDNIIPSGIGGSPEYATKDDIERETTRAKAEEERLYALVSDIATTEDIDNLFINN